MNGQREYLWGDRNIEQLFQMAEIQVNVADIRHRLGALSVEWKIEKKVLEWIREFLCIPDLRGGI